MSDLRIVGKVFEDLKHTFSTVAGHMDTARRSLSGTDGSAVGHSKLVDDVHSFADSWGYGCKQLGKHTQDAHKMIHKIGKTFESYDHDLAEVLKKARKGEKK